MKYPGKLKDGGTVGIICPSSAIKTERIHACIRALTDMGYKVKTAGNLDADKHSYIAGSGRLRAYWLNQMFSDPEVDAIFCARGGDGSAHMMEFVNYKLIRKHPKIFVGYSDVTNLLLGIMQNCHMVVFHGPMVSSNMVDAFDGETRASFYEAINGDNFFQFHNPAGKELSVMREGNASGGLTGGNLSLLSASIGTPYEVDTDGKILFIEEVGESIRKIDKWMTHLKNSGKLKTCAGILLGQFTDCTCEQAPEYDVYQYLEQSDIFDGLEIPIMYGIESGHGVPMMTLPMGAEGTMDTRNRNLCFQINR